MRETNVSVGALERAVSGLGDQFRTKDVSNDPVVLDAHSRWVRDFNYHAMIGRGLSKNRARLRIDLLSTSGGNATWGKVGSSRTAAVSPPSRQALSSPPRAIQPPPPIAVPPAPPSPSPAQRAFEQRVTDLRRMIDEGKEPPVPLRAEAPAAPPPPELEVSGPRTEFADGTYEVGVDIEPGLYSANAAPDGHWQRLRDFTREDSIIASELSLSGGPFLVEILPTDVGFRSTNCGLWKKRR